MDQRTHTFATRFARCRPLIAALSVGVLLLSTAPIRPFAANGAAHPMIAPRALRSNSVTAMTTTASGAGTNILDENAILTQNKLPDPQWYKDNIPFLDTPDANINGVYYYRWDNVRRHLRDTVPGTGYVSTEFSQPVGYSGSPFNAIVAAAGHDIYEARWLRDQRYMNDFETYWLRGGGVGGSHQYSEWLADAYYNRYLVNGDPTLLKRLLPDLIKQYNNWSTNYTADVNGSGLGLYYITPVADATEYTDSSYHSCDHFRGGQGYRPTINAYQYAAAVAISDTAALAGDTATAADFAGRAATLKANMQKLLWDPNKDFFMHLFTTDSCNAQGDGGMNWAGKRAVWREEMGFVPWAFNMPDPQYSSAWQYVMDPNYFYAPYGPTTDERTHDFEAEDPATTVITDAQVMSSTSASNNAYVGNISSPDSAVAFTVTAPAAGTYPVVVYYANGGGSAATQTLAVNGNASAPITVTYAPTPAYGQFAPSQAVTVNVSLTTGYNTLTFQPATGKADLNKITANPYFDVEAIPPTDAQRRNDSYCCHWDGPSWPYETSQTLMGLANLLDNYPAQGYVTKDNYFTLLENYATTQHKNGAPYIAEAADADTGNWIYDAFNHSENYNHSTFNDLVISGLIGVRPRADNTFELKPLVPASWDHFVLENLPYHGHLMTVLYDKDGSYYQRGSGLQIFEDGAVIYTSPTLGSDVQASMAAPIAPAPQTRLENYAANPVAADEVFLNQSITQQYPQPFASYTNGGSPGDSVWQAVDGRIYYTDIPNSRWTDYGSPNPTDYLGVDFGAPRPVNELRIYTYDDGGGVRAPASYNVQYWNDTSWVDAPNQIMSPTVPVGNGPNEVTFSQVITPKVRVVFTPQQVNGQRVAVGVTELQAWYPYNASGVYEAEQADISDANVNYNPSSNASNDAYVGQIDHPRDSSDTGNSYVRFTVDVPKTATYPVEVAYATGAITATHNVSINGGAPFTVSYQQTPGGYGHFQTETVFMPLNAGANTIQFSKGDQYAELDKITIQPDDLPVLQASYPFDEGSGITATDTSGHGADGTLTGGVSYSSPGKPNSDGTTDPYALSFDGTSGYVDVPNPVVDTLRSYSVAAWVKLNPGAANGVYHSAVSIDGTNVSGFFLQYCGACGKFAFAALNGDDTGASTVRAQAQDAPQAGTWYHLVGVYDATAGQLRLYVNGALQDTQPYTGAFAASGHTIIGAGKFTNRVDYWPGQIDDVSLYQGVLSDQQIQQLAGGGTTTTGTSTPTATVSATATLPTATETAVAGTATFTPLTTETAAPSTTSTSTVSPTGTSTVSPTGTSTPAPPTATNTTAAPTMTGTPPPPTATSTPVPPTMTSTATPVPPTATSTAVPPTATSTSTAVPPTATAVPPTSTSTAVPPTATSTTVPPTSTSTTVPPTSTSTTVPPTATSTPTALPVCQLVALPAFDTVPRGGAQALLVDAAPDSAITLTVRAKYPASATLYTDSSLGSSDGFGATLSGKSMAGGYRYTFHVATSGLALLTFAIPRTARTGTVVIQVTAREACGLFQTVTTFQVRGTVHGAARATGAAVTLAIALPRGDAPPANAGALARRGLLRVTTQGHGATARRVLRITYHPHTRPASVKAGAAHTRPHTLFGVAIGTGTEAASSS